MKIQPLLNNILVEKIEEDSTKSGIFIANQEEKRSSGKGLVVEVGQGFRKSDGTIIPLLVKKGDIILFGMYSPVRIDEKDYLITKEEYVLAIINKKDEKINNK